MNRLIASVVVMSSLMAAGATQAQEIPAGPGKLEVALIPGGATFVTSKKAAPDFKSYDAGAAVAYNFTRIVGVEGEVTGRFGWKQALDNFDGIGKTITPNMLGYSGNVVANVPGHAVIPYATGGVGGTTLYKRELLGIFDSDTFFTGNVGGGVKWFSSDGRWGVRGDYRFLATKSKDNAPEFFGQDNRYAHRVYGAVIINAIK